MELRKDRNPCAERSRGHIITGFRASEQEVYCRTFYIEREIRFPVRECTFYENRRSASKEDMEEIAWFLTTRKVGRSIGFVSAVQFRQHREKESESEVGAVSEVARLRECRPRERTDGIPIQQSRRKSGARSGETRNSTTKRAFERSSKRRKGYPSETRVRKGPRIVHGEKELVEKLGRSDLCP